MNLKSTRLTNPEDTITSIIEANNPDTTVKETSEDEHWQDVRERAAIAAMQGMLSNPATCLEEGDTYPKVAVRYANALVEELKKK